MIERLLWKFLDDTVGLVYSGSYVFQPQMVWLHGTLTGLVIRYLPNGKHYHLRDLVVQASVFGGEITNKDGSLFSGVVEWTTKKGKYYYHLTGPAVIFF